MVGGGIGSSGGFTGELRKAPETAGEPGVVEASTGIRGIKSTSREEEQTFTRTRKLPALKVGIGFAIVAANVRQEERAVATTPLLLG